jgi:hypothetical protein
MNTGTTGLTSEQRAAFEDRGLVRLHGLIPRKTCEAMADRLWAEMARKDGIQRKAPGSWTTERPTHFKPLQDRGAFAAMGTNEVRAVLDALMGQGRWAEPATWGMPLVCFPRPGQTWDVPFQNWHADGPTDLGADLVGRLFLILEPLAAQGGGTLVAQGSHILARRLAQRAGTMLSSAEVRRGLKAAYPWFAELMSPPRAKVGRMARFMEIAEPVGGVACQVAEMTGEPGDVWLMHPNAVHAGAPNVLTAPRLVLTQFVSPKA